jgi:hypothetical protein
MPSVDRRRDRKSRSPLRLPRSRRGMAGSRWPEGRKNTIRQGRACKCSFQLGPNLVRNAVRFDMSTVFSLALSGLLLVNFHRADAFKQLDRAEVTINWFGKYRNLWAMVRQVGRLRPDGR